MFELSLDLGLLVCTECLVPLPTSSFYKAKKNSTGFFGKCKDCYCKQVADRIKNDPEAKIKHDKSTAAYEKRNPNKRIARNAVKSAMRSGKIAQQPCEICGDPDGHAHHDDYGKPLEVRFLCRKHHCEWHTENEAKEAIPW
jgi:hypothetical protein